MFGRGESTEYYLCVDTHLYSILQSIYDLATILFPVATYNPFQIIRESVDSLCRDGADTPMPPYIGKAFTRTNFEDLSLFRYMIMVCE